MSECHQSYDQLRRTIREQATKIGRLTKVADGQTQDAVEAIACLSRYKPVVEAAVEWEAAETRKQNDEADETLRKAVRAYLDAKEAGDE